MTWGLPQRDFPILTPGQMNPYHQALSGGLDTYQKMVQSSMMPQQLQAEIGAKNAYSQNIGRQIAATVLSNPMAIATMSNEQRNALVNQLTSNAQTSGKSPGNTASPLSSLWNNLKSGLGMGDNTSQASGSPAESAPINNSNANSGMSFDKNGNNIVASPKEIDDAANRATNNITSQQTPQNPSQPDTASVDLSDPKMNLYNRDFGSKEANSAAAQQYPSPYQKLIMKQRETQIQSSAKADTELWKDRTKENGNALRDYEKGLSAVKTMKSIYPKLKWDETGFLGGNIPSQVLSGNAQTFDNFAKNFSTSNVRALQTGHITNTDFAIGDRLKPNRTMKPEAFDATIEYNEGLMARGGQKQKFDAEAKKRGMPVEQADSMWFDFINNHPMYNEKTLRLNKNNVKMSPFSANENAASSNPSTASNESSTEGKMPPPGTVWAMTKEGYKVPVHTSQIENAKKRGLSLVE